MNKGTCKADKCERKAITRGICSRHYYRLRMNGVDSNNYGKQSRGYILKDDHCLIPLGKDAKHGYAIVDKENSYLGDYDWTVSTGYAYASVGNPKIRIAMHRLITNAPKGTYVDHANKNTIDNRSANLRVCTQSQNAGNMASRGSKHGYRGVVERVDQKGTFVARIVNKGKTYAKGGFKTAHEAARQYDKMATELFGEFATLNKYFQKEEVDHE